jgi:hypothetical protein
MEAAVTVTTSVAAPGARFALHYPLAESVGGFGVVATWHV